MNKQQYALLGALLKEIEKSGDIQTYYSLQIAIKEIARLDDIAEAVRKFMEHVNDAHEKLDEISGEAHEVLRMIRSI